MGSSLWFDSSANSWWLFGGRQIPLKNITKLKIYTDLWRYDIDSRNWNRIFPNDKLKALAGGMITLRTSLFNDGHVRKSASSNRNPGVVLCGRSEGKRLDERSLAVYGPKSSRSDTVWQLELKDKQWTAYVCCCDNTERSTMQSVKNISAMPAGTIRHESNVTRNYSVVHGDIKFKDNSCNEMTMNHKMKQDLNISNIDNTENNTKKSKQIKNQSSSSQDSIKFDSTKSNKQETSKEIDNILAENKGLTITEKSIKDNNNSTGSNSNNNLHEQNISVTSKIDKNESSDVEHSSSENDKQCLPDLEHQTVDILESNSSNANHSEDHQSLDTHKLQERDVHDKKVKNDQKQKINSDSKTNDSNQAFCPDFQANSGSIDKNRGQPVAWCDTSKELLVALDLKVLPLTLWQFDLRTSHWTQQKVEIEDGTLWPGCSPGIRYASSGSSVYILCLPYGTTKPTSTRLVYRIDATNATLQALGQLQLNNMFDSPEGNAMWTDETKTILQTVDTEFTGSNTVLLIAYDKLLDIWILERSNDHSYFVQVENIWRGSALKWFRGFDAPFYHLRMAGQTWLLSNPRQVTQYWPRERGRFIIRFISHEENSSGPIKEELHTMEIKNHSEISIPILQHHQAQDGIKALVFFAFSLSIFAIFGMAVFVRRCVTCPPQAWPLRGDDGSKTTPPVIRYSVIPDDLAYPVA
ncbi:hypothetical protein C0J52_27317 [Blattella germanica]|nr:hypothetical protein C0J52_27317 [Blattella germanica]